MLNAGNKTINVYDIQDSMHILLVYQIINITYIVVIFANVKGYHEFEKIAQNSNFIELYHNFDVPYMHVFWEVFSILWCYLRLNCSINS